MAATTSVWRSVRKRVGVDKHNIEGLRWRLQRMSNPELLRFGATRKCWYSLEITVDQSPGGVFEQLSEARAEWNKRNPDLPLRDSF